MAVNAQNSAGNKSIPTKEIILGIIEPHIQNLGFEVVNIEVNAQRDRRLRIFIEGRDAAAVSLDDCASVSQALDAPLDESTEVESIFSGSYELEVSSPGVYRPLWRIEDFQRFEGERTKVHTFRPLTAEELGNSSYAEKNPKQKNFIGILGKSNEKQVSLVVGGNEITVPFNMITKANLEPEFN